MCTFRARGTAPGTGEVCLYSCLTCQCRGKCQLAGVYAVRHEVVVRGPHVNLRQKFVQTNLSKKAISNICHNSCFKMAISTWLSLI